VTAVLPKPPFAAYPPLINPGEIRIRQHFGLRLVDGFIARLRVGAYLDDWPSEMGLATRDAISTPNVVS
jgi:hypothetical protein